jgi:NRE family putative nickel resistance protein-like MFS transporter
MTGTKGTKSDPLAMNTLWRNRNFRLLFGAQIISLTGSGVTTVGLALFAYQLTGGASATAVIGNALTLRILAFLLFSQPAVLSPTALTVRTSSSVLTFYASVCSRSFLSLPPFGKSTLSYSLSMR